MADEGTPDAVADPLAAHLAAGPHGLPPAAAAAVAGVARRMASDSVVIQRLRGLAVQEAARAGVVVVPSPSLDAASHGPAAALPLPALGVADAGHGLSEWELVDVSADRDGAFDRMSDLHFGEIFQEAFQRLPTPPSSADTPTPAPPTLPDDKTAKTAATELPSPATAVVTPGGLVAFAKDAKRSPMRPPRDGALTHRRGDSLDDDAHGDPAPVGRTAAAAVSGLWRAVVAAVFANETTAHASAASAGDETASVASLSASDDASTGSAFSEALAMGLPVHSPPKPRPPPPTAAREEDDGAVVAARGKRRPVLEERFLVAAAMLLNSAVVLSLIQPALHPGALEAAVHVVQRGALGG